MVNADRPIVVMIGITTASTTPATTVKTIAGMLLERFGTSFQSTGQIESLVSEFLK